MSASPKAPPHPGQDHAGQSLHDRHEQLTRALYESGGTSLPARLVYVLTVRCNLHCAFCPQSRAGRGRELGVEDWRRVTAQLPDYARVTVTGGEPMLSPFFSEVMTLVAARHDCNVISNATLLTPKSVEFLLALPRLKVFSVSIDLPGNTNRDFTPERWRRLVEMLRLFVRRRDALGSAVQLDVKTVVFDGNAGRIAELHRLLIDDIGCDTHALQLLKGSPLQHASVMSPFEATFEQSRAPVLNAFDRVACDLEALRRRRLATGERIFLHPPLADLASPDPLVDLARRLNTAGHDPALYEPCMFPWSSAHINADGAVFPCQSIQVGDVNRQSLAEIFAGEPLRRFRQTIREQGTTQGCNRCGWLRLRQIRPEV